MNCNGVKGQTILSSLVRRPVIALSSSVPTEEPDGRTDGRASSCSGDRQGMRDAGQRQSNTDVMQAAATATVTGKNAASNADADVTSLSYCHAAASSTARPPPVAAATTVAVSAAVGARR